MKIEDVKVIVINKETLDKTIDLEIKKELEKCVGSALAPQLQKGESFRTRSVKWAIIEGTDILTDDECVYNIVGDGLKLDVFSEFEADENGNRSFSVFPRFSVTFTIDDLKEHAGETVKLVEFMGDRFNYNYRIETNQTKLIFQLKNLT